MAFREERDIIAGRLRRRPLELGEDAAVVGYGRDVIHRILPHREPMEFLDAINAVDLATATIEALSRVPERAPVFAGHFPGNPVYPGIFQIETMGQAALCLAYFARRRSVEAPAGDEPVQCWFTRVRDAAFLRAIQPGAALTVRAQVLECDEWIGLMAGQILEGGAICSYAILEAQFL